MAVVDTDRNLLFGVLALQAELIDNDRFAELCAAWSARKGTPLADMMTERGWLSPEDRRLVERLLEVKLQKHGGDPVKSLAEVAGAPVQRVLASIDQAEIHETLARMSRSDGHILLSTIGYTPETRERYSLTRLHAKGGIGQVWLAHDSDLDRDVALKELRPEQQCNETVWARFLEEARITGQLEHPNIVPVHELVAPGEGGQADRKPFYTMRFVKGRTFSDAIRSYHRKRQEQEASPLDLLALIQAFRGVCNAVAYAHSRGVIHRDLKGQNVVLGDFGEVIVLDWGLAKLVGRVDEKDAVDSPLVSHKKGFEYAATIQGQALGTPAYMSPEQAEGRTDLVGPGSDIYGLGAILYEILCGQPPFTGPDTLEVLRRVREDEPERPSSINPEAPRALEAVSRKAMAKRINDRYPSADDLAQDIERWLADEPVLAWQEPWSTRARRWLGRNRVLVTAGAAAMIAALIGLVGLVMVQNRHNQALQGAMQRETQAKNLAETRYTLAADAISAFYTGASEDVVLKKTELQDLRKRLLETALKFYGQLREQLQRQTEESTKDANLATRLYALANATERVGEIYSEVGQKTEALKAYEDALSVWDRVNAPPAYPAYLENTAKALVKMGRIYRQLGRPEEALKSYQRSVALFETLDKSHPYAAGDVAWTLLQLGSLQEELGRPEEARHTLERARDIQLEREKNERLMTWERQNLAATYMALGNLSIEAGRLDEGLSNYEKSHEICEKLVKEVSTFVEYQADLARSDNNLGYALTELGRFAEAQPRLEQGLALRDKLLKQTPLSTTYTSDLARSQYYLARLSVRAGRSTEARDHIQKGEDLFAKIPSLVPEDRFYHACLLALRVPVIGMGKTELSNEERTERQRYADLAMKALQDAVSHGYKKKDQFAHEHDLDPLRSRADFRKLVADLAP